MYITCPTEWNVLISNQSECNRNVEHSQGARDMHSCTRIITFEYIMMEFMCETRCIREYTSNASTSERIDIVTDII